jgi:very-short-patch-repair endonuclease
MEVRAALQRLGGVSDRDSLLALVTRAQLTRALNDGKIAHPARNLYSLSSVGDVVVAARRVHGVVSHLSAALAWGWKVKDAPTRPVVTVPRNRHPTAAGIDVRFASLSRDEVTDGRTTPVRTVLDCARSLPFDEALAVCDSALRAGAVDKPTLVAAARAGPRTGRPAALRVVDAADARAANPFESVLRAIALEVPGLGVVAQGQVGQYHADVADLRLRIAIEAESFEFHGLPEAFRHDIRRYTDMTRRGWLVARFVWEDVMRKPAYVREVLVDMVRLHQEEAVQSGQAEAGVTSGSSG